MQASQYSTAKWHIPNGYTPLFSASFLFTLFFINVAHALLNCLTRMSSVSEIHINNLPKKNSAKNEPPITPANEYQ